MYACIHLVYVAYLMGRIKMFLSNGCRLTLTPECQVELSGVWLTAASCQFGWTSAGR